MANGDCKSGVCASKVCAASTCFDKVKNGTETDIDCGGSCYPCADGKTCAAAKDCASGVCSSTVCAAAKCDDKVKNGAETDVDCGGGQCNKCVAGKGCVSAGDCSSGVCKGSVCAAPSCTDKVKNGAEIDVDCGGGTCPKCAEGKACAKAADCASGNCLAGKCGPAVGSKANPGLSCKDVLARGGSSGDGKYWIKPSGATAAFEVHCDMTTDSGGWTLFLSITSTMATGTWTKYMVSQYGVDSLTITRWGKKPANTYERVRVQGSGWHLDMKSAKVTGDWTLSPCKEDSIQSTVLISSAKLGGTPAYLSVRNNKSSGCNGIGHLYMGHDVKTGKKLSIKGVMPASDGAFHYLATWGSHSKWSAAPPSSLGGYKTQCPKAANDVHYRCSGFLDDPNWTAIHMFYR